MDSVVLARPSKPVYTFIAVRGPPATFAVASNLVCHLDNISDGIVLELRRLGNVIHSSKRGRKFRRPSRDNIDNHARNMRLWIQSGACPEVQGSLCTANPSLTSVCSAAVLFGFGVQGPDGAIIESNNGVNSHRAFVLSPGDGNAFGA